MSFSGFSSEQKNQQGFMGQPHGLSPAPKPAVHKQCSKDRKTGINGAVVAHAAPPHKSAPSA